MKEIYTYHYRPAFKSDKLLIEFINGVEGKDFLADLLEVISEIGPKVDKVMDLWMNDEVLVKLKSNIGDFEFSKDIWGLAFIMSDTNQEGIKTIESLLSESKKFVRKEVNFEDYK